MSLSFARTLLAGGIAALALLGVAAQAETFEVLHVFAGGDDGAVPEGGVTLGPDGAIYGTANGAGAGNGGTLFQIVGGQFQVLHPFGSGADGSAPRGALVFTRAGDLVGTTYYGGTNQAGTVFRYRDGRYDLLASLPAEAKGPESGLLEGDDGALYGTTALGGSRDDLGTLFRLDPLTAQTTIVHAFDGKGGSYPQSTPVLSGGRLAGTTGYGGKFKHDYEGPGVLYSVAMDGSGYASRTPTDGSELFGGLTADRKGRLWGVAYNHGPDGGGGVFRVDAGGRTEWVHTFVRGFDVGGGYPLGTLLLAADGMLYGTTQVGGTAPLRKGTVFRIDPATGAFKIVHSFDGTDGYAPAGVLAQDPQGRIVGATSRGGPLDLGVVYRLTP